jgi:hypothetical protein
MIRASGHFEDDRHVVFPVRVRPCCIWDWSTHDKTLSQVLLGQCQPTDFDTAVGSAMSEQLTAHLDNLRHLCLNLRTEEEIDELQVNALKELRTKSGVVCPYYMAIARKAAENDMTSDDSDSLI